MEKAIKTGANPLLKNADHCNGGVGGVCNYDQSKSPSVIQNLANAQGAPDVNPAE